MDPRLRRHPLGYWELSEKPTSEELQAYYANKYYQEANGSYEIAYSQEELDYFEVKLSQRRAVLETYLTEKREERNLLDVGCGEGYTLSHFRKHGWNVKGLDFSSAGVASKNPDCADLLVTGDVSILLQAELEAGAIYQVVWLQNVLEHVIDPLALLDSLRRLVAPSGLLVATVPNDFSVVQQTLLAQRHIDSEFWVAPPDHLTYFDRTSIVNAATATGWECVETLSDFPIDFFLFHSGSNYIRNKAVGKAAHRARVQIENMIGQRPIEDVIGFWSALSKLGLGRDLTVFLRPLVKD